MISILLEEQARQVERPPSAPDVPPHTTRRPPALAASAPNGPTSPRRRSPPRRRPARSSARSAESITAAAPSAIASSRFAALRLVATTSAPRCRAMASAAHETPRADADHEHGLAGRQPGAAQHPVGGERRPAGRPRTPPSSARPVARTTFRDGRDRRVGVTTPEVLAVDVEAGPIGRSLPRATMSSIGDTPGLTTTSSPTATLVTSSPTASTDAGDVAPGHVRQRGFGEPAGHPQVHVVERARDDANLHVVTTERRQVDRSPAV